MTYHGNSYGKFKVQNKTFEELRLIAAWQAAAGSEALLRFLGRKGRML